MTFVTLKPLEDNIFKQRIGYTPAHFYTTFYPRIKKYAQRFFWKNSDKAEDAISDTFVNAFRSYHTFKPETFEPETDVRRWIFTIAHNTCIDIYHQDKTEPCDLLSNSHLDKIPSHPNDSDLEVYLTSLLEQIPPPFRETVELRALGYSHKEIATELGIPIGTARSRLHRGRQHVYAYRDFTSTVSI